MVKFKFVDLFAGIGGFHLAMHELGGDCVFASEIDIQARKTYEHNFKNISPNLFRNEMFNDDIRKISAEEIPDFDVLCAGFPCQPFSQAGFRRGFMDNHNSERGNLFFNIAEIIASKRPKAFFLENVRGLYTHDNGKTFKIIADILRNELGYSVYHKIVRASDYGLPQHRPRTFIIGFRDDNPLGGGFYFPDNLPLKFNMSYVWGGKCSRDVGFTLRVGGRGSDITDRRNWDSYLVDGVVKRLGPDEGKLMQGFPDDFEFPVTNVQAMKQLGNSVAVDAIKNVGRKMINYMGLLDIEDNEKNNENMGLNLNKGEWAEPYAFLKIIKDKRLYLSDKELNQGSTFLDIEKVTNSNLNYDFLIFEGNEVIVKNKITNHETTYDTAEIITESTLEKIKNTIINASGTFNIPEFSVLQEQIGVAFQKGGNSSQKADVILDFNYNQMKSIKNDGFGIKSLMGAKPTLLNASSNTNFVYSVTDFSANLIDEVNSIDSRKKIMDRIEFIKEYGGEITFNRIEKDVFGYNLKMVDGQMPLLLGELLLKYFQLGISDIKGLVKVVFTNSSLIPQLGITTLEMFEYKIKKLLLDYTCGFFPGSKWDGKYSSNGTIVVDKNGLLHGFHIINMEAFMDYLFDNVKFDTPSSGRHGFGSVFKEKNGELFFKLNLQLRYK